MDNELLIREFIGKDADRFLGPKDITTTTQEDIVISGEAPKVTKKQDTTVNPTAGVLGWAFGPVWFFYRKSYLIGFGFLFLSVLIGILTPEAVSDTHAIPMLMGLLYAFSANKLYLWDVRRKVKKIVEKNQYLSQEELIEKIRKKGGTSVVAVIIYAIMLILYIAFIILLFILMIAAASYSS
ncbi:MAG: DUF2628 domain-containing protein [Clostridia bacterium]|nr:DUF2628 domain-containing protein [Clostridia bacterium]